MVLKGSCVSYFISDDFFTGSAEYLFSHSLDVRGAFLLVRMELNLADLDF